MTALPFPPASPASSAMTDRDRIRLRGLLTSAREVYLDQFEALVVRESEWDGHLLDELDQHARARAEQELAEIEAALSRMDAGTYGCCEACAKAIPVEALYARPHIRFCATCHPTG